MARLDHLIGLLRAGELTILDEVDDMLDGIYVLPGWAEREQSSVH
jgi:hypothetical protein